MNKGVTKIELVGLEPLLKGFKNLPVDLEPSIIRAVARKPANKIVSLARKKYTPKDTGASKRSIGILNVKNRAQRFLEIGIKGRSLAYIFFFGSNADRQTKSGKNTGAITPTGNVVEEAASEVSTQVTKEMQVDLNKVIARSLRRHIR